MQRQHKHIGAGLRAKILEESMVPGCKFTALARAHQISAKTLYAWRKKYNRGALGDEASLSNTIEANAKFVEVKVPKEIGTECSVRLKKAVLEFDEFSIAIEGKLNHKYLSQILEILR